MTQLTRGAEEHVNGFVRRFVLKKNKTTLVRSQVQSRGHEAPSAADARSQPGGFGAFHGRRQGRSPESGLAAVIGCGGGAHWHCLRPGPDAWTPGIGPLKSPVLLVAGFHAPIPVV